jgi:hypothetical protein
MTQGYSIRTWGIVALVVIGALAGIGAGLQYQQSEADLTQAEVNQFITLYLQDKNNHVFISEQIEKMDIVGVADEIQVAIKLLEADHHEQLAQLESKIGESTITMRNDITQLKLDVAKLKAGIDDSGTTFGSISISTDRTSYNTGDVVRFSGLATPERQVTSEIYIDKTVKQYTPTTQSDSDGKFNLFWVIPSDAQKGTYTAIIKDSASKSGQTTVIVK